MAGRMSTTASNKDEGKCGAVVHRSPGQRAQTIGDRVVGQQGVAPLVQVDLLREQLGAKAVARAEDRVDAQ
jgi:hypothetical protein